MNFFGHTLADGKTQDTAQMYFIFSNVSSPAMATFNDALYLFKHKFWFSWWKITNKLWVTILSWIDFEINDSDHSSEEWFYHTKSEKNFSHSLKKILKKVRILELKYGVLVCRETKSNCIKKIDLLWNDRNSSKENANFSHYFLVSLQLSNTMPRNP